MGWIPLQGQILKLCLVTMLSLPWSKAFSNRHANPTSTLFSPLETQLAFLSPVFLPDTPTQKRSMSQ